MISVIDIFAGPGGLGEGFSALKTSEGNFPFKIKLSIEMNSAAHETLELRSFFRQFKKMDVPDDYYRYLRGEISRATLFTNHKTQSKAAKREAWKGELGKDKKSLVRSKIRKALAGAENWVLVGGPPCQAYSVAGRARNKGIGRDYENWAT
jgi:DNA (cytosine-5)-methyltransferase 1